jgi:hypothetical protein
MATSTSHQYHAAYRAVLEAIPPNQKIWVEDLIGAPGLPETAEGTRRKHLKDLITASPDLLEKVLGLYPKADTIIDLVEQRYGLVTEANLDSSNSRAAEIVRGIAQPVVEKFVDATLRGNIVHDSVSITKADLMVFLLEDFTEFSKGAGNGLVSIAGTLNERLLMRALQNGGLQENIHFKKTGTNSQADLIIHSTGGARQNLGVEIKSYHARERLLRGLQDITGPKVGFGFFKDPHEFNAGRTQTLLQTQASAVYMPAATLSQVDSVARAMTTNERLAFQSRLYRPIEQFVTDAAYFHANESLPRY